MKVDFNVMKWALVDIEINKVLGVFPERYLAVSFYMNQNFHVGVHKVLPIIEGVINV